MSEDDWDVDESGEGIGSGITEGLLGTSHMNLPHKPFTEMSDEELRKWVAENWRASDYLEGCKAYAERRRAKEG